MSYVPQLWRRSLMLPLSLSLFLSYTHSCRTLTSTSVVLSSTMFSLDLFIYIHNIGLFTNIALNGTLTLIVVIALNWLRPIQLLSESIPIWLFGHNRIEQSVWFFWPRPRCCEPILSFLWLFLVFDCWLFLNRIVGSSHKRDIFITVRTSHVHMFHSTC